LLKIFNSRQRRTKHLLTVNSAAARCLFFPQFDFEEKPDLTEKPELATLSAVNNDICLHFNGRYIDIHRLFSFCTFATLNLSAKK